MPLLGSAAMLLSFDIAPEAIAEHDEWHSHEHLPERLSIPGFLRGTRWVALRGEPRYFVLYEVASLATLTSDAYLARLNDPTPWTQKMMRHYRNMNRGLCSVLGSAGAGLGHFARLIRFSSGEGAGIEVRDELWRSLEALPAKRGICSAHFLAGAAAAPMTNEQRIRGADAGVPFAILVTGYDQAAVADLASPLGSDASAVRDAVYASAHSLSRDEIGT